MCFQYIQKAVNDVMIELLLESTKVYPYGCTSDIVTGNGMAVCFLDLFQEFCYPSAVFDTLAGEPALVWPNGDCVSVEGETNALVLLVFDGYVSFFPEYAQGVFPASGFVRVSFFLCQFLEELDVF